MPVQRNPIVGPFSVNTPLVDKKGMVSNVVQQRWLQSLADGINGSAQLTATIPTSSSSPGQPGQFALGPNTIYVCTALNTWTKILGSSF